MAYSCVLERYSWNATDWNSVENGCGFDLCELRRFLVGSRLRDDVETGQGETLKAKSLQRGTVVRRWRSAGVASLVGRHKEVEVLQIMREGWHSSKLLVRLQAITSGVRSDQ